ncbi:hypothetical protein TRFO_04202 [Tritrichomonas foetus]|uniref:Uncharacterized protein n=1 Tax=Tritrichomonas foetus TaxID=1144522 RepID=A0A1J4KMS3_9EUKA|nr:hypothetical protein TRFO_04202 [Tritrichomonas foetus]|eukprot:OHT10685.1 hypothetical protein TRFO_04202 [Tritrichomonas foetus]
MSISSDCDFDSSSDDNELTASDRLNLLSSKSGLGLSADPTSLTIDDYQKLVTKHITSFGQQKKSNEIRPNIPTKGFVLDVDDDDYNKLVSQVKSNRKGKILLLDDASDKKKVLVIPTKSDSNLDNSLSDISFSENKIEDSEIGTISDKDLGNIVLKVDDFETPKNIDDDDNSDDEDLLAMNITFSITEGDVLSKSTSKSQESKKSNRIQFDEPKPEQNDFDLDDKELEEFLNMTFTTVQIKGENSFKRVSLINEDELDDEPSVSESRGGDTGDMTEATESEISNDEEEIDTKGCIGLLLDFPKRSFENVKNSLNTMDDPLSITIFNVSDGDDRQNILVLPQLDGSLQTTTTYSKALNPKNRNDDFLDSFVNDAKCIQKIYTRGEITNCVKSNLEKLLPYSFNLKDYVRYPLERVILKINKKKVKATPVFVTAPTHLLERKPSMNLPANPLVPHRQRQSTFEIDLTEIDDKGVKIYIDDPVSSESPIFSDVHQLVNDINRQLTYSLECKREELINTATELKKLSNHQTVNDETRIMQLEKEHKKEAERHQARINEIKQQILATRIAKNKAKILSEYEKIDAQNKKKQEEISKRQLESCKSNKDEIEKKQSMIILAEERRKHLAQVFTQLKEPLNLIIDHLVDESVFVNNLLAHNRKVIVPDGSALKNGCIDDPSVLNEVLTELESAHIEICHQ